MKTPKPKAAPKAKPKPTHGGARKGAGRPEKGVKRVTVYLPPALAAEIEGEVKRRKAAGEKPSPSFSSVIIERCER